MARRVAFLLMLLAMLAARPTDVARGQPEAPPFEQWLQAFLAEARERGYAEHMLEETLGDIEPLPRVIESDRRQDELIVTFEKYLSARVTPAIVRRGRQLARQHRSLLMRIERSYQVQPRFLLAVWGMETRYGRVMGRTPIFQALATLAWEPRRADFFRAELFSALTIVSRGYIDASRMKGSWAGAMGHPQFMPSSYLKHAVDFDHDGRRDIWTSTADSLASIANYLTAYDWRSDQTWGREVRVSSSVRQRIAETVSSRNEGCYAMRDMTERISLHRWHELGVRRVDGRPLPQTAIDAALVETDSADFLVYTNYDALLRYNCAHHYALSVALLADRLR